MDILDKIKTVVEVIQRSNDMDLYKRILDLQASIIQLSEENLKLRQEKAVLKEKSRIRQSLIFKNNVYIIELEKGGYDGPFCPTCWDSKEQLVRLTTYGHSQYLSCKACEKNIMTTIRPTQ